MKLENDTEWGDRFLRRLVSWCCRQVGCPVRSIQSARFHYTRRTRGDIGAKWSGCFRAVRTDGTGKIRAAVACREHAPVVVTFSSQKSAVIHDRTECLVMVTAHELGHASHWNESCTRPSRSDGTPRKRSAGSEPAVGRLAWRAVESFQANRESLLAAWSMLPSAVERQVVSPEATKVAHYAGLLSQWETKLRRARTKVAKYRQRVRYYSTK